MLKMAWGHIQKGRGAFIYFFFLCEPSVTAMMSEVAPPPPSFFSKKPRAVVPKSNKIVQLKAFDPHRLNFARPPRKGACRWFRCFLRPLVERENDVLFFFFFLPFSFLLFNRTFSFFFLPFSVTISFPYDVPVFFFFFSKRFKIRMKIGERFTHVFASWLDCIRIYYSFLVGTYITRFFFLLLLKFQMQQRRCPRGSWFVVLEYLINCQWRAITFRSRVGGVVCLFIYIAEDVSDIKVEFLTRFRRWLLLGVNC